MILEKWKKCGVNVQGVRHKNNGSPCQDRVFSLIKNEVIAISLADGAGSRKHSEEGAELVTQEICSFLCNNFDELVRHCENNNYKTVIDIILKYLHKQLDELAFARNQSISELASTLLFFAMKDEIYILGHIGDGVIGFWNGSDETGMHVVSKPENGESPNITFFVPDPDSYDHLRIKCGRIKTLYGVVLMSDGTADLLYNLGGRFNKNTIKLFTNYRTMKEADYKLVLMDFLNNTVAKYSDDDLSINLLYREDIASSDNISQDYLDYFLEGITSKSQIIDISSKGKMLKSHLKTKNNDFNSSDEVKEYLEW